MQRGGDAGQHPADRVAREVRGDEPADEREDHEPRDVERAQQWLLARGRRAGGQDRRPVGAGVGDRQHEREGGRGQREPAQSPCEDRCAPLGHAAHPLRPASGKRYGEPSAACAARRPASSPARIDAEVALQARRHGRVGRRPDREDRRLHRGVGVVVGEQRLVGALALDARAERRLQRRRHPPQRAPGQRGRQPARAPSPSRPRGASAARGCASRRRPPRRGTGSPPTARRRCSAGRRSRSAGPRAAAARPTRAAPAAASAGRGSCRAGRPPRRSRRRWRAGAARSAPPAPRRTAPARGARSAPRPAPRRRPRARAARAHAGARSARRRAPGRSTSGCRRAPAR